MNITTPDTSLAVIAAGKKPPISPPLRKYELLKATARAMHLDSKAKHDAAMVIRRAALEKRDRGIIKEARKSLKTAQVAVCDWSGRGHPYEVSFRVKVPREAFVHAEQELAKIAIPKLQSSDEFYAELKKATNGGERWQALLTDKAITEKLLTSGRKLLELNNTTV